MSNRAIYLTNDDDTGEEYGSSNGDIYSTVAPNAGAHNSIYRGKYLGTSVTSDQYNAIDSGDFTDLFIGDYWTINGVNYRIAAFDYWLGTGDTECTIHHVVIVPDSCLGENKRMNSSNTTAGGYVGSEMYTTNLNDAKTIINTAFESSHILSHREFLSNAIDGSGNASDWSMYNSTIELINEQMVYGGPNGSKPTANKCNRNAGIDNSQLPIFALRHDLICNRSNWWLRSIVSTASFAFVHSRGEANETNASDAIGVRPCFGLCKSNTPPSPGPTLKSFSTATDQELSDMISAYYNGTISLSDIQSVWSVGDVRTIHLDAMTAPNPYSGTWEAQDISVVILDFDHTELATPINGKTKALITVQTRECMNNDSSRYVAEDNTLSGNIYINGDSSLDTTFKKWSELYMRTYLNSTVLGAISSSGFKSAIKQSKHNRLTTNGVSGVTTESVTDTLFIPSYPEIYGNVSNQYYINGATPNSEEGTQFEYFKTSANRVKQGNNNGAPNSTDKFWWNGSPATVYNATYQYCWDLVQSNGNTLWFSGSVACGLAPAWAM